MRAIDGVMDAELELWQILAERRHEQRRNLSTRLRHSALEITEPLSRPPAVC